MKQVATIGQFTVETNGSGELFVTVGKTKLRMTDVDINSIRVTFHNPGQFIPTSINGLPGMIFSSK